MTAAEAANTLTGTSREPGASATKITPTTIDERKATPCRTPRRSGGVALAAEAEATSTVTALRPVHGRPGRPRDASLVLRRAREIFRGLVALAAFRRTCVLLRLLPLALLSHRLLARSLQDRLGAAPSHLAPPTAKRHVFIQ